MVVSGSLPPLHPLFFNMDQICVPFLRRAPATSRRLAAPLLLVMALAAVAASPTPASALAPDLGGAQAVVSRQCDGPSSTPRRCDLASLSAIDAARADEGLGPLDLPQGYDHLDVVQQLVAVTNAERTSRGLPALHGPDTVLGQLAQKGLDKQADPAGPAGTAWASNLARGVLTVLEADYEWMYNDGPGGANAGCTATAGDGCWAHRDNILSPWAGSMGAAEQPSPSRLSLAELMVASR